MKIVIFLTIIMISHISFAKFESEEQLFAAFSSIGMNTVVEITDVNSAKNLLVHTKDSTSSIDQFNESTPMSTLNYSETNLFGFKKEYSAYSIAEIVLCYSTGNSLPNRSAIGAKNNFEKCYLLPTKIKDIVSKINSL